MKTLYANGKVILEDGILEAGSVLAEDGIITGIFSGTADVAADETINAGGNYISPGFIDTHIHGGAGFDVMDADADALAEIAKTHLKHGCTSFLPTTLTGDVKSIVAAVKNVYECIKNPRGGAKILGVHLEGPCFSMKFKGAQNPRYLLEPSVELFEELGGDLGIIKRISLAPELNGAFDTAEHYAARGVCVSVAHSDAGYACVEEAARRGFTHVTHLYNGMSYIKNPDFYCSAGVVEAGLLLDSLTAEVIADGKHMPVEIIRLIYKCKGPDGMLLTTDATRPTNMPEGRYELGGLDVTVTDGVAMLSDRTSFAGSVATCDRIVRFAYKECGIKLQEAVKMAGLNHARLIGEDFNTGSIKIGKRAEIIIFDDDINVRAYNTVY